jgi:hypothetical protein
MKKAVNIALAQLLMSLIYPFIYKMEPKEHHLRITIGDTLIQCFCTKYERNILESLSNVEVQEDNSQEKHHTQYIAILTVNFKLFQHLCIKETFPNAPITKIKIRV